MDIHRKHNCGKEKMEEKLKTLKEIEYSTDELFNNSKDICDSDDLRAEAVKWVREDLERLKLRNNFGDFIWERPIDFINEWMKRFNLTEEDLE